VKVQMKVYISGARNGVEWPAPGVEVDVPDDEGAELCAAGLAIPVRSDEDDVEKRDEGEKKKPAAKSTAKKP
jgi:hypothetical protein